MAQNQNGFNRRSSSVTRTYPGTAARLPAATPLVDGFSTSRSPPGAGSVPTVFVRPLSRSQLAPVHGGTAVNNSPHESSSRYPPPTAARPISLDQPRPDSERHRNLYLGAPLSLNNTTNISSSGSGGVGGGVGNSSSPINSNNSNKVYNKDSLVTAAEQVRLPTNSRTKKGHSDNVSQGGGVVTLQPTKRTLLEPGTSTDSVKVKLADSSITCPYCRKCRCAACATPRPLPSRWICSKSIHCGPEPVLDYLTCLCCVKGLFYHCGKDHEPDGDVMCADKPCSCGPHRKFWRWGCMAAMSLVFPCLCLYWPCKGCIRLTEKAYQSYHSNGCKCHPSSSSQLSQDVGGTTDQSEDEDHHRSNNIFGHPPPVAPRMGSNKLLSSNK